MQLGALLVILLVAGVVVLAFTCGSKELARKVERTPTMLAATVEAAPAGQAVVVEGRVDPELPPIQRGLALFVIEKLESNTAAGEGEDWVEAERYTPPFALHVSDGVVRVVNDDYVLRRPAVKYEFDARERRVVGYRPGDSVLLVGTRSAGGVAAEIVFGGTREELIASTRGSAVFLNILGIFILALASLPVIALRRMRGERQPVDLAAASAPKAHV